MCDGHNMAVSYCAYDPVLAQKNSSVQIEPVDSSAIMPAKAGIQGPRTPTSRPRLLDARFRGHDGAVEAW
jgi:hypothetical protein